MDYQAALEQSRMKFIEQRTKTEIAVNAFLESLSKLDDDVKQAIGYDPTRTTVKDWIPELWNEPCDQQKYDAELAAFEAYVAKARTIADRLNEEALKCAQML